MVISREVMVRGTGSRFVNAHEDTQGGVLRRATRVRSEAVQAA